MRSNSELKSPPGNEGNPSPASARADWLSVFFSLLGMAIGAATAFGWLIGIQGLTNIGVRYIPMAPSTAVCLVLLGAAIILRSRTRLGRVVSILFVAAVAFFALAKMIEYWTGSSLGMDELFVRHPGSFGAVKKARMAPMTAVLCLLSAAAAGSLMRNEWRRIAGGLSATGTTICIVILLGYIHGTPFLYGGSIIPVAFPTALAFFFIGCSLIGAAGPGCWPLRSFVGPSTRAVLLRWFLPVAILGAIANGCVQTFFLKKPGYNPAFVTALSTLGFSLIISAIISKVSQVIGGRIDKAESDRNAAQQSLEALNSNLEEQIAERTIELRAKNDALQEALAELTSSHEDLKRAQLQLIQAEKMQSIGNLAAGVAHEVKNPLAILGMGVDCLTTQSDLGDDTVKAVLGEMREAVGRADRIVDELLSYSSPKDLESQECDLEELLANAMLLMRHEFVNRNISVAREFARELPRCRIDAQKIEQVFINLFTNACHAMPNGGILTLKTEVKPIAAGDVRWDAGDRSGHGFVKDELVLMVTVSDTGTGIPSDKLDRVFDPFFTTKPTGQGTGLGLAVSRKIIELHGGRLELANFPQGGAIATVTFRLGRTAEH